MDDNFDRWMARSSQTPDISEARLARVVTGVMTRLEGEDVPMAPAHGGLAFISRLGLPVALALVLGAFAAPVVLGGGTSPLCLATLSSTIYDTSEVY